MADIVDDFIQRLRALAPDFPAQAAKQLESQTRQAWGGAKPYVAKRPALQRAISIGESLRAQRPIAQVFEDAGVRKTFGYELLRRR